MTVDRILREGSKWECAAHHLDSGKEGPTAFVLGGQHGDEPAGYKAASRIAAATVERGDVWVVPRMNTTGIEAGVRAALPGGVDYNRTWHAGEEPTTNTAKAVWSLIREVEPDVFLDLHSSRGFYKREPKGFGQAIFPTAAGAATARETCDWLNRYYVRPSSLEMPLYEFTVGNTQGSGDKSLFSHKVGYETEKPGFLIETARPGVPLDHRIEMEFAAACRCLELEGVVIE